MPWVTPGSLDTGRLRQEQEFGPFKLTPRKPYKPGLAIAADTIRISGATAFR